MKIAFLQKYPFAYPGIMSLSASLPDRYQRDVFIGDLEKDVVSEIVRYQPDVVGLSMISTAYVWMEAVASRIKQSCRNVIIVAGGIHPTICPEVIEAEAFDAVCIGEGEFSFPHFLNRLEKTGRLEAVDGFWVKRGKKVIKRQNPSLVLSLDTLPDEDRDIYYRKYAVLRDEGLKHFMTSRGCPYECSFCCHHVIKKLYRKRGRYLRWKSPEKVVGEIARVKERYGISSVYFLDDVFVLDVEWLKKFAILYRRQIDLPYYTAVAPAMVTEEIVRILKESGCHTMTFGVETADEEKRRTLLNKPVTNEDIIRCARLVKKYGIKIQTTNMFGLPFETVQEAFDTIRFNIRIGTDYLCSTILIPFPKTEIEKTALNQGILNINYLRSQTFRGTHLESVFCFKGIEALENVQKIAHLALKFPFLIPVFRRMVRFRLKRLFFFLSVATVMWRYKSENAISWIEVTKVFWRHRKNYL